MGRGLSRKELGGITLRLTVFRALKELGRCRVGVLAEATNTTQEQVRRTLYKLRTLGLVVMEAEKGRHFYQIVKGAKEPKKDGRGAHPASKEAIKLGWYPHPNSIANLKNQRPPVAKPGIALEAFWPVILSRPSAAAKEVAEYAGETTSSVCAEEPA